MFSHWPAARMQRWALILAAYQYDIEYRKSAEHANADAMSRLVRSTTKDEFETEAFVISYVDELPITAGDLASATRKDPVLARVYDMTLHGWLQAIEDPLSQPYFSHREELSVDQGCLLWGLRVVIPGRYRDRLLDELDQEHHHPLSKRVSLVARTGCRHCSEGQWLSSLCVSWQVSIKGTLTPMEMACQALGENSH